MSHETDPVARARALVAAATKGPLYVVPVEESEGNLCITHAHFDVYCTVPRFTSHRDAPGILEGTIEYRNVNVACVLADNEDDVVLWAHAHTLLTTLAGEVEALRNALCDVAYATGLNVFVGDEAPPCKMCGDTGTIRTYGDGGVLVGDDCPQCHSMRQLTDDDIATLAARVEKWQDDVIESAAIAAASGEGVGG